MEMKYRVLPEQTLYIDLPDTEGLKIKGIIRGNLDKPTVVLVHGRPGSGNDLLQYLGARYLSEHGLSSLRMFLYDYDINTRNLLDCTLQTHVNDFDVVIKYLRSKNVPKVFAVGHSYGGLTVLRSNTNLDGIVLWDPSHGSYYSQPEDPEYQTQFPTRTVDYISIGLAGSGYIIPRTMDDEDHHLGNTSKWVANKDYPIKIIGAQKGILTRYNKQYFDAARMPKEYVEIDRAGHLFDESDKITLKLFEETADWFERFGGDE